MNRMNNTCLNDLENGQGIAATHVRKHRRVDDRAEQIISREQQGFEGRSIALQIVPTIRDLRSQAEEIRVGAIKRSANRLGFDGMREEQRDTLDMLTRSIVDKILQSPLARLQAAAGRKEGLATLEATRALFGLDATEGARTGRVTVDG